jgi:thiamine kinase-like enzyme
MNPLIHSIIAQIPAWRTATSITVEPQKGGLTNANYLLTVDGERFVLRLSGDSTVQLGIHRQTEHDALMAASNAGIAPEVVLFTLPEGHLVTRFIDGCEWTVEEFKAPDVIRRVAETMQRVHALPPIAGFFSPYRDIEQRLAIARTRGVPLPEQLDTLLEKMYAIKRERTEKSSPALCHNDPFHNNFLDNGHVYLLDWEFAGMGDVFFDLASVAHFFSPEQKAYLLECYSGEGTKSALRTLDQMWFVVAFWNATWALLQIGNPNADFDYAALAERIFTGMTTRVKSLPTDN